MTRLVSVEDVATGDRIKALRKALELSHEDVARASAGNLDRQRVLRIESGELKLNSEKQRKGLAVAFGISRDAIDALIEDRLTVEEAIALARRKPEELAFPASSRGGAATAFGAEMPMGVLVEQQRLAVTKLPNLVRCIDAHAHYEPPQKWSPATIAAASLLFETDFPVNKWPEVLNRIEQLHAGVTLQVLGQQNAKPITRGARS